MYNIEYVPIYNMYQYTICTICTNIQYVPIYNMYNMYQYTICTHIQYEPIYNMYQYTICTNIQYVPIYNMYPDLLKKVTVITGAWERSIITGLFLVPPGV